MQVRITPAAKRQLKKLPKFSQILIIERLKNIELNFIVKSKVLVGYKNVYRIRVGDYRLVYRIMGKNIYVILIGHRKEVYKLLERLLK